jgi:predicted Rossmann-fold nucleotide-binding protein
MRAILRGSVAIEREEYAERRERLSALLEEQGLNIVVTETGGRVV